MLCQCYKHMKQYLGSHRLKTDGNMGAAVKEWLKEQDTGFDGQELQKFIQWGWWLYRKIVYKFNNDTVLSTLQI
jgi:hypothetical protein